MCLKYDEQETKDFWNTGNRKGKTWCWGYKFYRIEDGKLFPYFADRYLLKFGLSVEEIKAGWLKSNRENQKPMEDTKDHIINTCGGFFRENNQIHRGIHVIIDPKIFEFYTATNGRDIIIVKVKCYKKDFVAASTQSDQSIDWYSFGGEAVFMKVFLPKIEYDKKNDIKTETLEGSHFAVVDN